jgi:chromosome partitioning protein
VPTVVFVSPKGGVGKTTSALLLALGLVEHGHRVALVDSDPNLPLTAWGALPGRPEAVSLFQAPTFADLPAALRRARADHEWIVIDTEGGAPRMGGWAIAEADLVVTPLAASALEAREAAKVFSQVADMERRQGRRIGCACLFARTPAGARRSVRDLRAALARDGRVVLDTALTDKEAFRALFTLGGPLSAINRRNVSGVASAQALVTAYTRDVMTALEAA